MIQGNASESKWGFILIAVIKNLDVEAMLLIGLVTLEDQSFIPDGVRAGVSFGAGLLVRVLVPVVEG